MIDSRLSLFCFFVDAAVIRSVHGITKATLNSMQKKRPEAIIQPFIQPNT